MNDPLAARYDAVPYRHGAVPHTHPARLAAIARLHGIDAAPPNACRVLELGCGDGMNLLPLAERLPDSRFVGVDFSAEAIARGEAARTACGLENATLVAADLRAWEAEPASFDYIIAHGVYSWVPTDVRERLLALCARALRPQGVAYISYNTLPGWSLAGGLREVLLGEVARLTEPRAQLRRAQEILASLRQAAAGGDPYSAYLRATLEDMLRKPPELFFHDELAPENAPCTFTQFVARAAAHGLHYVAEAHYASMQFAHAPAPLREALAELQLDFLQEQQYLDVLYQRWLRNSIVTRAAVSREPTVSVLRDCVVGLVAENNPAVDLTALPLDEALRAAAPVPIPCLDEALAYRLFSMDVGDVLDARGGWLAEGGLPRPSALMRYEAKRGLSVTNRWHEPVALTPDGQRWLLGFNGGEHDGARRAGFIG